MVTYIYCRKSNKTGSTETSLERQEQICREYCYKNGLKNIKVVTDVGSARLSNMDRLKGLQSIMSNIADNDQLIIYDVTRFSRNTRIALNLIHEHLVPKKVFLFAVNDNVSYTTYQERNRFRILLSTAEHESDTISDRVKNGMAHRKSQGHVMGNPPFGKEKYIIRGIRKFRDNDNERKIIAKIDELKNSGLNCPKIAFHLNRERKLRRGKQWTPCGVRRIVKIHNLGRMNMRRFNNEITKLGKVKKTTKHTVAQEEVSPIKRARITRSATTNLAKIFEKEKEKESHMNKEEEEPETESESSPDPDSDANSVSSSDSNDSDDECLSCKSKGLKIRYKSAFK